MVHEALPATDAIGSPRKMNVQGMISLVLFIVFLAFFVGMLTGLVDGRGVFSLVRDAIAFVGSVLNGGK
jgi:hypothetical protein